jgi:hypothetical protein
MVFNAAFKNISAISDLLVEETGENHRPVASHWQALSHIMLHRVHLAMSGIRTLMFKLNNSSKCKNNKRKQRLILCNKYLVYDLH